MLKPFSDHTCGLALTLRKQVLKSLGSTLWLPQTRGWTWFQIWNKAVITKHIWFLVSGGEQSMWCQGSNHIYLRAEVSGRLKCPVTLLGYGGESLISDQLSNILLKESLVMAEPNVDFNGILDLSRLLNMCLSIFYSPDSILPKFPADVMFEASKQ